MNDLAQPRLSARGEFFRHKAYLEDLVSEYVGVNPGHRLALAVWFDSSRHGDAHKVLQLFTTPQIEGITEEQRIPLLWKTGATGPPFADISSTSLNYFSRLLGTYPDRVAKYFRDPQILYFQKSLVPAPIAQAFNLITEPRGLLKGWYVDLEQYAQRRTIRNLLSFYGSLKPEIGIVKINESADFENCRAIMHTEVSQIWLPLSPEGLKIRTFFNDLQDGRAGYLFLEGGSLYRILKFEVRTAPEYADWVLELPPDGRYTEVYLRAVHPTQ